MLKPVLIVDIDQTLIDSTIRENFCYNNDMLDLLTYRALTPTMACKDSLLPLGEYLEANIHTMVLDFKIILLTARVNCEHSHKSLAKLMPNILINMDNFIHRGNIHLFAWLGGKYKGLELVQCSGAYKAPIIDYYAMLGHKAIVIDDCPKVLNCSKNIYRAICARDLWHYNTDDFDKLFNSLAY